MPGNQAISLRNSVTGAVTDFLEAENMSCEETRKGLVELINLISLYREEGKVLFPEIYITDDIEMLSKTLINCEIIQIGESDRKSSTLTKALKKCAPLGVGGWAIYILRKETSFVYGIFRSGTTIISVPISDAVILNGDDKYPIIHVHQIAEKIVEAKGARKNVLVINFGIKSSSASSPIDFQKQFIESIIRDVKSTLKDPARIFFSKLFLYVMQNGHGNLSLVMNYKNKTIPNYLNDGIVLEQKLSIIEKINELHGKNSLEANAKLNGIFNVIAGMMMSDGIVIYTSDGSVLAYNVFLKHPENDVELKKIDGGARSRTYAIMKRKLSKKIIATYMQSQDGNIQTDNNE